LPCSTILIVGIILVAIIAIILIAIIVFRTRVVGSNSARYKVDQQTFIVAAAPVATEFIYKQDSRPSTAASGASSPPPPPLTSSFFATNGAMMMATVKKNVNEWYV
jgi:hypothetical protein